MGNQSELKYDFIGGFYMSGIGPTGFILIGVVVLLLFGPQKLPELGRAFGNTLREFKKGTREMILDNEQSTKTGSNDILKESERSVD